MCGIAGIIHPFATRKLIEAMTDVMYSRGPDGAGYYVSDGIAMGMRRLSIIDLEHGWQPLYNSDNTVVAFQNGEIYNYLLLRRQLQERGYTFKTNSDTEVLAHGFRCWGVAGLLERLDGMYAAAILDKNSRQIFLIRDRFGEKPLFFAPMDMGFAYASDLRILAALPGVSTNLSMDGLNDYLAVHYVSGRKTILKNVFRVLPGEFLTVSLESMDWTSERYYTHPIGNGKHVTDDELSGLIESAVSSRLISDVPVGVFLSGGLDSSIVAAIAASRMKGISTFSMGFKSSDYDESDYAKFLASYIGSRHHHFYFDETSFIDLLPRVVSALDEPIGDQALLPTYWLCKEASQHVKVVLSGEGADEIFAGYGYYSQFSSVPTLKDRIQAFIKKKARQSLERFINNSIPMTPSGFPLLTDIAGRNMLIGDCGQNSDEWECYLIDWLKRASDPLQRATCADLGTWLPDDLLVKFDRMAMAHSLEGRAPFLDPKVVDAGVVGLYSRDRLLGGESKIALRRIAHRWLPEEIVKRKKQGFVLPMGQWISNWAMERKDVESYFNNTVCYDPVFSHLGKFLSKSIQRDPSRERLHFALIMLCEWSNVFYQQVSSISSVFQSCL